MENKFLPISKQDMIDRGWEELDFVLVTGDAYVDHHSFGTAIISRVLESAGYKVGIIAQPDWRTTDDFMKLGKPRLAFLVNAGNMDSMVNHYSVSKKHREKDMYSPGGKMGYRPDRATIVYCNKIREAYSDVAIVIGGIEASLRRFAHYDYWSDKVRKSMLIDSGADLLVYGMSEKQIVEVANALNDGYDPKYIRHIDGTCYISDTLEEIYDKYILIPSYKEICEDKMKYVEAFKIQYDEQDPFRGNIIVQPHGSKYLVQNKPEKPLSREELDEVYGLPYQKTYHPVYEKFGGIPAIEEVKFSIVSSRGCFGSCSFCAITFHQGRAVQSRSEKSIIDEAIGITNLDDFKGYIHDVGGPTANFRRPACKKQITKGACKNRQCLSPSPCKNLDADHSEYLHLLRAVRKLPKIKKVFVRSGIRYDYVMADKNNKFLRELIEHHVSGQLKVAPEHISEEVLKYMQKPAGKTYDKFRQKFFAINEELGKKQYLIPYLMSSHPGSTLNSAIELAEYLRDTHYQPEQVQDFYPTPGTLSTTMFYTGIDPLTMKPVYVPKSKRDKAMQRALLQYRAPRNYDLVYSALVEAGREDLIGFGHRCLIKPKNEKPYFNRNNSKKNVSKETNKNKKTNTNNRSNKNQQKSSTKKKKKH
ncbi:TPA: YgiQ family radical SAM protein [Clostridioides difficile]|uniref:YgiQ family radical SAM protein n=3 Tax=Clostridioides difficile TaxID=1496 RepID=UPI00038D531B|nr:YgiQ family radical SAM protein [Clostridioides difficile]OFU28000.1 YgiQ family radical SAM protein [Clostridium sp. HMSC19B12]EGT3653652.1 YgiQ family radical SAM protein [Clostridioides difficile]EGT3661295.1 YgiQ family radical SAM protein [Clostridioides difficile]EGT3689205.1 YgiQ family radical SAM protein [Clostridioides difficile]EGT3696847.1 YgiQ family radical SAM protein [Clostridioides difficile]